MSLLASLQWYWDLTSADATITDQHSGLALSRIGTATTNSTGGPDGGPCISVGNAAGLYRALATPKTISYDDGYTVNVWAYSTGSSSTGNWLVTHRNSGSPRYFQVIARVFTGNDSASTIDNGGTFRECQNTAFGLNAWQMLTFVDSGTSAVLYRNGVEIASSSTALGARSTGSAGFVIGGDWSGSVGASLNHRGRLAMVGVWNEPLNVASVSRLYNGGMGRRYADLGGGGIIPILRQHYAAMGVR
jgi:hypothetical protein